MESRGYGFDEDHPRVCGEKNDRRVQHTGAMGSPPRMRGKALVLVLAIVNQRITPAYAGKSRLSARRPDAHRDHPRVCGEKSTTRAAGSILPGSPPRMRGKAARAVCDDVAAGITPAYAGKRLKRSRSTVSPVAIVPLFPSVCNKPVVSDGSPAVRDAPLFLPAENAVPASPACNLRSL